MQNLLKQTAREKESRFWSWINDLAEFFAAPIANDPDNPDHPIKGSKVYPRGNLNSPIIIFAGIPDKKSFLTGKAINSPKAREIAKKLALKEEDLFYAYAIPSFPVYGQKVTNKDIQAYRPLIKKLIWIVRPKYLLILDDLARKLLAGLSNIPPIITEKDLNKIKDEIVQKTSSMKREDAWDIVRALPDEVTIAKDYVVIPGSLPDKRSNVNDIDLHVVDYVFNPNIEQEIKKRVKDAWRGKLQFFNNPQKPKGNYIPAYDLILKKRKSLKIIKSKVDPEKLVKNFTYPTYKRVFSADKIIDKFDDGVIIEPYIKGKRVWILKLGDKVKFFDAGKNQISLNEKIEKELAGLSRNFLIETLYQEPLLYAVDILYHQTADIRHLYLLERKGILEKVIKEKPLAHVKMADWHWYKDKEDVAAATKNKSNIIIKDAQSRYDNDTVWTIVTKGSIWASKVKARAENSGGMKVKLFQKYTPLKAGGLTYATNSYQSFSNWWNTWASGYAKVGCWLECKVDGIRSVIEKKGDRVEIYSEGWQNLTKQLPNVVNSLKKWKENSFILEGELIDFNDDGTKKPRTALDAFLHPPAPSDKNIKIIYYDILYLNGKLLTGLPYSERRKIYTQVVNRNMKYGHAEIVKGTLIHTKKEAERAIRKYAKDIASEGVFCKVATSRYSQEDMVMWCLPEDQLVWGNPKPILAKDLKIGTKLLDNEQVVAIKSFDFEGEIYEIKAQYMPKVRLSGNHKVLAIKAEKCIYPSANHMCRPNCKMRFDKKTGKQYCDPPFKKYKAEWVRAKDLTTNHYVVFPKYKIEKPTGFSEEQLEFFGWYVAEGFIDDKRVYISLGKGAERDIFRIIKLTKNWGWGNKYSLYADRDEGFKLNFRCLEFAKWLEANFGNGSENKHLPVWLLQAIPKDINAFMRGYLLGDGNLHEIGWQSATVSEELSWQWWLLWSKSGQLPSYHFVKKEPPRQSQHHTWMTHGVRKNHFYWEDDDNWYIRVRRIKRVFYKGKLYHIQSSKGRLLVPFLVSNSKIKNYKEAKLIAIMKREVSKGNWAYGVAFKENNQIIPFRTRKTYTKKDIEQIKKEWQIMKGIELKAGDHQIQKTFNTGLNAPLGSLITVRFEEMQEFKDDGITYYSILKPLPTDTSELGKVWGLKEVKKVVQVGTGPLNLL